MQLDQQRKEALAKGNECRIKRGRLKAELQRGEKALSEVLLLDPVPEWLATAEIRDIARAARRFGYTKVDKTMALARVDPSATFGGTSLRLRKLLHRRFQAIYPRSYR